ncbi:MAG: Enoyl-CoA hydratase, partial [Solirubrobacterales bacterium]|nr:Enoyl-CoA hydratase [Solirubrobacterales bacterium]
SVALARQMLWRMLSEPHPMNAHRVDSRAVASRRTSADAQEGVSSFKEKRPASFPDRVSDGLPEVWVGGEPPTFS